MKKTVHKILKLLTGRLFITGVLIVLQLAFLFMCIFALSKYFVAIYIFLILLSILVMLFIISKRDNPIYKLAWAIPILLLPVFGGIMYLFFGNHRINPKMAKKLTSSFEHYVENFPCENELTQQIENENKSVGKQAKYLSQREHFCIWNNTKVEYFSLGEQMYQRVLAELEKAEKFIFLEFFIIEHGVMWDSILQILKRKAQQGVDVRVMYDDIGSVFTLPWGYGKKLSETGVKVRVFNPLRPSLDSSMNYRDHRKILVIDGNVGFTGGINLADEYINQKNRFGHWKDTAVMLEGDAVWSLSAIFLRMWSHPDNESPDYSQFKPQISCPQANGYVAPFSDSPIDESLVSEAVYMNIINNATDYVHICTPYLILDSEMTTALVLAAKSGVDVTIITPHKPDKWYVHAVTRSNYSELLDGGVKIYEYTPGFIHAKTIVADGQLAVVGTANFDYRSFYLHFECGVWMYKTDCIAQISDDFEKTLAKSQQITAQQMKEIGFFKRLLYAVLKVFSPLM